MCYFYLSSLTSSFFPSSPLFIIVKLYACVYKYCFSRNGYINFLF